MNNMHFLKSIVTQDQPLAHDSSLSFLSEIVNKKMAQYYIASEKKRNDSTFTTTLYIYIDKVVRQGLKRTITSKLQHVSPLRKL
jgi:Fic family protein